MGATAFRKLGLEVHVRTLLNPAISEACEECSILLWPDLGA